MALPNEDRRAPGRGRRPEDAPPLAAVPTPNTTSAPAVLPLPAALAQAVLDKPATPAPEKTEPQEPPAPRTESAPAPTPTPEPEQPVQEEKEAAPEGGEVVVVQSCSAADAARAITWLGVTYRPPDVWRERQPSLSEEWAFVMKGDHLPEQGPWRAAARGYAVPAMGLITVLHALIWVLRSPARNATAWAVGLLVAASAAFML